MKKQAFLCLLFAIQLPCIGADTLGPGSSFRIVDYRPIGYQTQSLQISPSLNMNARDNVDSNYYSGMEESASMNGSLGASASHYFREQTKTTDLELSTRAYLSGSTSANANGQSSESANRLDSSQYFPRLGYGISNSTRYRKYSTNAWFFECLVSPSFRHQPADRSISVTSTIYAKGADSSDYYAHRSVADMNSVSFSSGLGAGIGRGWIADVTGAAIALDMADCIAKVKGGAQTYSAAQMRDLAWTVDRLRRRRIFDSRLANIESVDTLCQFLGAAKFVDTATVRLAMEINDVWNYGFSQPRFCGKEIKCMPLVNIDYYYNQSKTISRFVDSIGPNDPSITAEDILKWPKMSKDTFNRKSSDYLLSYGARVYAGFSNPIGRFFEVDGSIELSGTMNTLYDSVYYASEAGSQFNGTYPNATGKLSLTLSWFPSIRSTIGLNTRLTESADFNFSSLTVTGTEYSSWAHSQRRLYYTEVNTTLQATYYVSPRCSYQIWGSGQYVSGTKRDITSEMYSIPAGIRNLNFSFGSNLSYALF
jgi:hypothetical protein